jgi:hypothetical protein
MKAMKRSGDFCEGDTMEKREKADLQGSEVPGGSKRPCIGPEDQLKELSNIFKSIFEGVPAEARHSFASLYDQAHLWVVNGSLKELWSCLNGAADNYLSKKATELTGLIGMDLIEALNALWFKYQDATDFILVCLKSASVPPNDQAGNALLKSFKHIIVMPDDLNGNFDFDWYMKKRRPVHAIFTALLGTLTSLNLKEQRYHYPLEKQIRDILSMLRTLEAQGFFQVGPNIQCFAFNKLKGI